MAALGMICEWNPFHLGHAWLLRELKRCYSLPVVCVMSGNFVQRGEPAVAEKRARAEMALRCGADVVFELPTVWAMASAERFARGGVALLRRTGVVTQVAFGSECGDAAALMRVAACLDGEDFRAALQRRLAGGDTFAVCRERAAAELLGETDAALLREPNNILGIEYCRALRGSGIGAVTLPRTGARHDGAASGGIASASEIPAAPARGAAGASHGLSASGGGGGTAARDGAGPRAGDAGKLRARGAREAAYAARGGFSPL